jgi:DNA polymerase-3 subunit gamma/tau
MSYLVFARKWRPLTFDDVVGQGHITETLKKAIEKNRIAHAYIFSGTRGVGKTTTARILARALNCEKGPTPTPCGTCDSCRGIVSGSSFDVLEIDGASNNSVDDIRNLRENVGYSSMGGKYRIFVIDEVHMLSKPAFNALLKTLEEPPPDVIFIFATTEPQKIPATINSRCQRYDFRRIVPEQILERLAYICNEEKIGFEKSALMLIARKADGSMRDALSLLDQVCSYRRDTLTGQDVRRVLGLVGTEVYERIMDAVAAKSPAPVLAAVQQVLDEGYDLHEFVVGFEEHVRNLLFVRVNGNLQSAGIAMEPEIIAHLQRSSERFAEGDLLRMMEIIRRAEGDLRWNALPRFAVEMMLLKLAFLDSTLSIEHLLAVLGEKADGEGAMNPIEFAGVKKKPELTPSRPLPGVHNGAVSAAGANARYSAPGKPVSTRPAEFRVAEEQNFEDRSSPPAPGGTGGRGTWPAFIAELMRDRPNLGAFLSLATVAGHTDLSIDLVYPHRLLFQFNEVTKKPHRDEITKMLHRFMGRPVEIRITLEPKQPDREERKYIKPAMHAVAIDSEIEREPIIRSVLDIFDGEILE